MLLKTWLVYALVSALSGSPLLGIAVAVALWYGGASAWLGRLPDLSGPFKAWSRRRHLRMELGMNPRNVNAATELGGMLATRAPAEAKAVLEDVVERCPDLPLPLFHLGRAQLASGQTEAGRQSVERALTLKPDLGFGEPLVVLGDHALRIGKADEARAYFTRATGVHSSFAQAWYKLGVAAKAAGDTAGARSAWETALSSTRHSPAFKARIDRPWRIRAWVRLRLG